MAVTSTKELRRWGEVDSSNYRTYYREWHLETDDPQDGPIEVSAAVGLILWTSSYGTGSESDPYAKCKSIKVEPLSGELYKWRLVGQYDNKPFDANTIANNSGSPGSSPSAPSSPSPPGGTDPQFRPWSIKFGARQTEEHITEDVNGLSATASNGQPFEGGLTVPKAQPYFTLTWYSAVPNWQKVGQYVNRINNAMWMGFNTGTLRCSDYQISSQFEPQWGYFYMKEATFEINDEGWDMKVLDAGTHKYGGTVEGWTPIKDAFGQPVTSPVPLNGFGQPLIPPAAPVFKSFQVYRLRNFNLIF